MQIPDHILERVDEEGSDKINGVLEAIEDVVRDGAVKDAQGSFNEQIFDE